MRILFWLILYLYSTLHLCHPLHVANTAQYAAADHSTSMQLLPGLRHGSLQIPDQLCTLLLLGADNVP
jgi:alpha-D-ribose 1-methylphosphonate 5-triphosphate synthase subunit PhnH